jgi:phage-related protein
MAGAQQALASARRSAATSIANAEDGVTRAERSLTDAQRAEKQAQDDLTTARQTAADQLKALSSQLANSALDQRSAQLAVDEARAALDAANDPANKNTDLQRRQAQLDYDEAVQRLKDQTAKTDELTKSAAAQRKAGIEGSQVVKDAEDKLASAHQNTADQAAALAKAQKAVGDAELQAADSIKSAQRGIESARLSASKVTVQAATKEDAYQKALKKLSPSARELFDAIAGPRGLKSAFSEWSRTLQPEVLPLFTRGVDGAKASLPGLTPLVLAAADGIGILFDKASAQLKTPFWQGFKADIKASAEPALIGLGVAFGNVFKGMAGVIDAFLPHMTGIAATMDRITGRFANWGSNLKGSPGFAAFLDYVKENGPKVAEYIGQILTIVADVAIDIQPITESILGPLIDGLAWVATNLPEIVKLFYALYLVNKLLAIGWAAVAVAVGIFDTAMTIASLETWSFAAALAATGISELVLLIEAAVVLLALAIYELWTRAGWFREGLKAAWKAIGVAIDWLWKSVFKPSAKAIGDAFVAMGDAAVWLWTHAIKPAFDAIWYAVRFLVTVILTLLITPVYLAIKYVLAPVFVWLWKNAIKPAFDGIATAASWLWTKVLKPVFDAIGKAGTAVYTEALKPAFDGMKILFKDFGIAADAVWKTVIKPTFGFIGDKASWLYHTALKPPFDLIKSAVGKVADAFTTAKDGINKSWSKLADIAKKPVKFIISTIYNKGIVPVWNAIAKVTQVDPIHTMDLKGWATGGVLPGYTPGRDPHEFYSPTGGRIALSGGESIMRPEFTRAVGSGFVNHFNRLAATQGVTGVRRALGGRRAFSGGGILGSIGDLIGGNKTLIDHATGGFTDYLTNPAKFWDALLKTVTNQVAGIGDSPWASMIGKLPVAMVKGLKDAATSTVSGLLGGSNGPSMLLGGGNSYTKWDETILQALKLVGQPSTYLGITQRRMMQESGGNPFAVNLTDSNARAGHPSVGLMQLIAGTFKSHAGPFLHTGPFAYGVSENPLAQFYASMKYALSRYGSLPAAYNQPGGYDNGGYLPTGTSLVYNHTGHPEPVFTSQQFADIRANAERGGGPSTVNADVRVFVGDREITDIVRTEIDVHDANTAFATGNGRRI